jgi:hypothetical protein
MSRFCDAQRQIYRAACSPITARQRPQDEASIAFRASEFRVGVQTIESRNCQSRRNAGIVAAVRLDFSSSAAIAKASAMASAYFPASLGAMTLPLRANRPPCASARH